jgi:nucleoside-diphosphate-sugar epimerase
MARPDPGAIYNVCDDVAAAQSDVIAYACALLGVTPPPPVPLDQVAGEMSPMALSFWRDNRRVDNARMKYDLGAQLKYPDYRSGLQTLVQSRSSG